MIILVCTKCGHDEEFDYDHTGVGLSCPKCGGSGVLIKEREIEDPEFIERSLAMKETFKTLYGLK